MNWTILFSERANARMAIWARRHPELQALIQEQLAADLARSEGLPLGEVAAPAPVRPYRMEFHLQRGDASIRVIVTLMVDVIASAREYRVMQAQLSEPPGDVLP